MAGAQMASMTKQQEAATVKMPYAGIGIALVLLAIAIALIHLPRIQTTQEFRPSGNRDNPLGSIWEHHHVWLGAIAIFTYVGAEVAIGSFLVNYMGSPDLGGISAARASKLVAFYWGGAMVGRFIGSAALQRMKTGPLVGAFAVIAGILVGISMLTSGNVAIWSMLLVGLFNSIMFPSIFTLGTAHMGPLTGKASGLLVMAIVGGAIIPVVQGAIADKIGIHHCFILPLICYLFIVYYGFIGSRPTGASAELVAAE
jgi:FHS family L-fucose permease-like MFS transporter